MSPTRRADIIGKDESSKPGPGHYSESKPFGKDAPAASMRGKSPDRVRND